MTGMAAQRVTMTEGRMTVSGVSGGFVQGAPRKLRLQAEALVPVGGFALRDSMLQDETRLEAVAQVKDDRIQRLGAARPAERMRLSIRTRPDQATDRILLGIDARAAGEGEADALSATLWLPSGVFAALRRDLEAGQAGQLSLTATTNLWVEDGERDSPPDRPVTWYLGLDGGGAVMAARGLVETLSWRATPAQPLPAETDQAEEEPPETTAEALGRLNWSLRQMTLVLVFLLIVIALK